MSLIRRAEATTIPLPYVFPPSGSFDGNDGAWSTFIINIGDSGNGHSGQDFKVFISTSGSVPLIPIQASWCDEPDQLTCAKSRGVQPYQGNQDLGFQSSASSSWKQYGIYNLNLPTNVNYLSDSQPNASYGLDTVGLGADSSASPQIASQLVAGITTEGFFMGTFGLSTAPTSLGSSGIDTFLTVFNTYNNTPSLSYGYTAGAQYHNKGVLGNLILGGYDQSRFTSGVQISMPDQRNSSLVVGVQSIVVTPDKNFDTNVYSLTSEGFYALIDSTLPYLWLPQSVCDSLANIFQLTYDSKTFLYTVNDTSHTRNLKQNATISFKIGNTANPSNDFTSIVLPYAAFDLQASFPIYDNATRYFPIKPSPPGYYVLGRTFLQEAYLVVDYERGNFTVAPANFSDPLPSSHIVTIYSPKHLPPQSKHSGPNTRAIAGIAVGATIFVLILLLAAFLLWRNRRERPKEEKVLEIDSAAAGPDVKAHRISELATPNLPPPRFSSQGYFGDQAKPPLVEPILEMESPPAVLELESPPLSDASRRSDGQYFDGHFGSDEERMEGRLAGVGVHELPGDDSMFQVQGQHFEPIVRRSGASPQESPRTEDPGH
ncbi:acid protease [Cenococcum geophilum 1.58]|uniref:Acid protease n=1 Tax=Cenococcum geophilum 1.58 TaxID=794803 RepID=A0ACC8EMT0_9PEZI|nr:acid protease [Cenococcum geophilum 1.58]